MTSLEDCPGCGCGLAAWGRGLHGATGRGRGRELGFEGGRTGSNGAWGSVGESGGRAGRAAYI